MTVNPMTVDDYLAVRDDPELVRQYSRFVFAFNRCKNEGFKQMWANKIAKVVALAHKQKMESQNGNPHKKIRS